MPPQTLEPRVESLEQRVTVLEQLPARVDHLAVQISQLRDEMRAEFSATAQEIMAHARMLHEDLLSRIALLEEGRPSRRGRTKRR
jgi:BMFP domain-containing protein YqiC